MSTHLFVAEWHRTLQPDVPSVINTKRVLVVIFGALAVLEGSRIAYECIARRRRRARECVNQQPAPLAAGRRERLARACDRDLSEAQLMCVVCAENPKELILLPCGHVCLCQDCSDNITQQCPICRARIESRVPAFIA